MNVLVLREELKCGIEGMNGMGLTVGMYWKR
jgi:hypothetical protein